MSGIKMGQANRLLIQYLAENGPRTMEALLLRFQGHTARDMSLRLRKLASNWWVERGKSPTGETVWQLHPDARTKLPDLGITTSKRGRPRDVVRPPAADAAQPRRVNLMSAPVWTPPVSAPARPGAMDFMACPSRGF